MRKEILLFILLIFIGTAKATSISDFSAEPEIAELGENITISANIFSQKPIFEINNTIFFPTGQEMQIPIDFFSRLISVQMPSPIAHNISGLWQTFNITIDCADFTDGSKCWVWKHEFNENCINVTFDDSPNTLNPDLDIGLIACIDETDFGYTINFTRWGYEAGNDIRARFVIASDYGVNYSSNWILNGTGCAPECYTNQSLLIELNKTIFGGNYKNIFTQATEVGTYLLNLSVKNNESEIEFKTTSFSIKENQPPVFLSFDISPQIAAVFEKIEIQTNVVDQSTIKKVEAHITGATNKTITLEKYGQIYIGEYYAEIEGEHFVNLEAEDIFNNSNISNTKSFRVSPPLFPPTADKCHGITFLGLLNRNLELSPDRLRELMDFNYYCAKNILGLWNYDFYIEIKQDDGALLEIDGKDMAYGKVPPTSANTMAFSRKIIYAGNEEMQMVTLTMLLWA